MHNPGNLLSFTRNCHHTPDLLINWECSLGDGMNRTAKQESSWVSILSFLDSVVGPVLAVRASLAFDLLSCRAPDLRRGFHYQKQAHNKRGPIR